MAPILLIAEESSLILYLLKNYARISGIQAVFASEGERVMEITSEIKPDLILLNIHLPGKIRGWDVLDCLKTSDSTKDIPIIVFQLKNETVASSIFEKADGLLPMPLLYEDFQKALNQAGIPNLPERKSSHVQHEKRSGRKKGKTGPQEGM